MIDLKSLPNPQVLETPDFEAIVAANLTLLQRLKPDYAWLESDAYMLLIEAFAYRELHLRQEFNNRLQGSFLLLATGSDLDAKAVDYGLRRLAGEPDEVFRERILQSLHRFSTAGSKESYEYHARSVSAEIDDVLAISPAPGQVSVFIASLGEPLSDTVLPAVREVLDDAKVRPITDEVQVAIATNRAMELALEVQLEEHAPRADVEEAIRKNFAKAFKIHERLTRFEILIRCDVEGVYNATLEESQGDFIPEQGERLVVETLTLNFQTHAGGRQ